MTLKYLLPFVTFNLNMNATNNVCALKRTMTHFVTALCTLLKKKQESIETFLVKHRTLYE